ncbi:MAG: glycosyltransferase [Mariprofundaceae bacterium]|nr:glycosyltransferase [Mariprofundaceae bacterium]
MRLAYFLGVFPSTSETFVLHQIVGAVKAGHAVDIHAYQIEGHVQHDLIKQYDLMKCVNYRPSVPDVKWLRCLKACPLMLGLLLLDTQRFFGLLKLFSSLHLSAWLELFFLAWPLRGGQSYDVIHAHFGPNGLMAVRLRQAGFLQGKVVTSFHGFDANVVPNLLGKGYYQSLFEYGDGFIVSSLFIAGKLEQLGCAKHKIHRIAVGIDVEKWDFHSRQGDFGEQPIVISVGRLVEVKGFSYAIAGIQRVKEVFPKAQYHIVGDGPLRGKLEQQVVDLGLQGCVRFCGSMNQDELIHMYQSADMFVMPSVRGGDGAEEGQGMVLLEAQAAGLPVVATKSGGIPESVPDGTWLVEEKNIEGLAQAMIACLKTSQREGYDGMLGCEFVQKNFNIEVLNQQLLKFYRQLQ